MKQLLEETRNDDGTVSVQGIIVDALRLAITDIENGSEPPVPKDEWMEFYLAEAASFRNGVETIREAIVDAGTKFYTAT